MIAREDALLRVLGYQLARSDVPDPGFRSLTYAGVYLLGVAQSQNELARVEAHARNQSYVRRVISHVRVKSGASAAPAL